MRLPSVHSVRTRVTVGATVVVGVALIAAGLLLASTVRSAQLEATDSALELRATNIESLLDGGAAPASVAVESDDEGFVQILDANGRVVAASANLQGADSVMTRATDGTTTGGVGALGGERFRARVHNTDGGRRFRIVVGTPIDDLEHIQDTLVRSLLIGLPALLALIAALIWIVVGRALHPVESIRARVDEIGARQLDQRVPVPRAHDEIGHLAVTMNEMLDRLQSASARQARFVSDASHELRTPIAIVQHEIEVAIAADDLGQWRETGPEVLDENERMQRLVDDLLLMARLEQPRHEQHLADDGALIDLDDLVIAEIHRRPPGPPIDATGISAGQVRGSPDQLARVVRNLLDNAVRHARTSVAVHVASADGKVIIDIDDDGEGVPDEHRERVFERFGRADTARARNDGGTGLGLAIAREIIVDHGGTITLERSPWLHGARFTVILPDARHRLKGAKPSQVGDPP
jgi:signal transduction histidine kinase